MKIILYFYLTLLFLSKAHIATGQQTIKPINLASCSQSIKSFNQIKQSIFSKSSFSDLDICELYQSFKNISSKDQKKFLDTLTLVSWRLDRQSQINKSLAYRNLSARLNLSEENYAKLANDIYGLSAKHRNIGNWVTAFHLASYGLELSKQHALTESLFKFNVLMSDLSSRIEDCESAGLYINSAKELLDELEPDTSQIYNYYYLRASFLSCIQDFEMAKESINKALNYAKKTKHPLSVANAYYQRSFYYPKGQYMSARIQDLNKALDLHTLQKNTKQIAMAKSALGHVYLEQGDLLKSKTFLKEGLNVSMQVNDKENLFKTYSYLEKWSLVSNDIEKAYMFRKLHDSLYFELYGNLNLKRIFNIQKELSEDAIKEQFIQKEQAQMIKTLELSKSNQQKSFWISILALISIFSAVFLVRWKQTQKRRDEHLKDIMEKKVAQLEIESLRSQMNPHFIFNSLNSIKSYIANKEARLATNYLNKFSKLIRLILNHSKKDTISVEEELEALRLYLIIEQLRLEDQFSFEISCPSNLNHFLIPPLILQPYVENAIWHGLLHKKGDRFLKIKVKLQENFLNISIRDNGVGRDWTKTKNNLEKNHKSFGMAITQNRIALNNQNDDLKHIEIIDHKNSHGNPSGTEVLLSIKTR